MTKRRIQKTAKLTESDYFKDQKTLFGALVPHCAMVSHNIGRHVAKPARGYATWLFLRATITARSLLTLCEPQPSINKNISYIDHASIASLARGLIENIAVLCYVGDDTLNDDEWQCRKLVLDIHDCVNRTDFMRLIGQPEDGAKTLEELQTSLANNPYFRTLEAPRQKALKKGDDMFIPGRHNSMLILGWGDDMTKGVYKYLSHQTHTQSLSFGRTQTNKLYTPDSPYAYAVAGFALEYARRALGFGVLHMVKLFPYVEKDFDPIIFAGLKSQYTPKKP